MAAATATVIVFLAFIILPMKTSMGVAPISR
jgi:hypothetical protein